MSKWMETVMEFPVKVNGVEKNPQKNVGKVLQITNFGLLTPILSLKESG
jgi:hypothetical protein